MTRAERGIVLLEALVALAILSVAGIAVVSLVATGLRGELDARERERTLASEDRVLTALTLLKRGELDRRIGRHLVGEFVVDVQRPEPTLYRIAITAQRAPGVEDVVTVVYKPEARHGP